MADLQIDDLNVASNETLITPEQLKREIPLTDKALQTVATVARWCATSSTARTTVCSW